MYAYIVHVFCIYLYQLAVEKGHSFDKTAKTMIGSLSGIKWDYEQYSSKQVSI